MKNRVFNAFLLLAMVGLMFTACKKDYLEPPIDELPIGTVYTIDSILKMRSGTVFDSDASVYGIVTADEQSGNLYKAAFIQDRATGAAIELYLNAVSGVRIGDSIRVYLKDVTYSLYNGMPQLKDFEPDGHIVILNPGFMVGPYDAKPSSGKLLMAAYKRRWMATPSGGKSFVHVNDVANAVVNALSMGGNGERYLLTGMELTLRQFYTLQAQVCGYRQHIVSLPDGVVRLAGRLGDLLRRLGIATQLSTCNVRQLLVREYYSTDKASKDLAYTLSPLEEAIKDFFCWQNEKNV